MSGLVKEFDGKFAKGGDHKNDDGDGKSVEITVIYNGLKNSLTVTREDLVGSVLSRALAMFGNPPNPHVLSLYNDKGEELKDGETVKNAKVKKGDSLLLRPSTVKAG